MVERILVQYPRIVFTDEAHVTKTDHIQYKIWMKNQCPIRTCPRLLSFEKKEYFRNEIEELLSARVIVSSKSPTPLLSFLLEKRMAYGDLP